MLSPSALHVEHYGVARDIGAAVAEDPQQVVDCASPQNCGRAFVGTTSNETGAGNVGDGHPLDALGPPHSRLLVSIARQMGLDVDQVGDQAFAEKDGARVSLMGPLDRLLSLSVGRVRWFVALVSPTE